MGLDLALGVIILVAAFRGWFQGFVSQAVQLGSLVVAVYTAAPGSRLRQALRVALLSSIQPELIDRMLWWVSAVAVTSSSSDWRASSSK